MWGTAVAAEERGEQQQQQAGPGHRLTVQLWKNRDSDEKIDQQDFCHIMLGCSRLPALFQGIFSPRQVPDLADSFQIIGCAADKLFEMCFCFATNINPMSAHSTPSNYEIESELFSWKFQNEINIAIMICKCDGDESILYIISSPFRCFGRCVLSFNFSTKLF